MECEYRDISTSELRAEDDASISGVAAVFYRKGDKGSQYQLWDDVVERIMPDAFDRALADQDDVVALYNHDSNLVLGRRSAGTLELSKGKRGLEYRIKPPDTEWANGLRQSIMRGDITGSSFQFRVQDEAWIPEGKSMMVREIRKVELVDVGPVTFPAYKSTSTKARAELRAIADTIRQARVEVEVRDRWKRNAILELLKLSRPY